MQPGVFKELIVLLFSVHLCVYTNLLLMQQFICSWTSKGTLLHMFLWSLMNFPKTAIMFCDGSDLKKEERKSIPLVSQRMVRLKFVFYLEHHFIVIQWLADWMFDWCHDINYCIDFLPVLSAIEFRKPSPRATRINCIWQSLFEQGSHGHSREVRNFRIPFNSLVSSCGHINFLGGSKPISRCVKPTCNKFQ